MNIRELKIDHDVLVIGGGIAGIQTAIDLSCRGFKVVLIEKEAQLGGRVARLSTLYPSYEPGSKLIAEKLQELNRAGVRVYPETEVKNVTGFVGNFDVQLKTRLEIPDTLRVGAIVVAVGSDLYQPEKGELGFGKFSNVFSNEEFEQIISKGAELEIDGQTPQSVAFIQCVGSRGEKGNPGCSRYCCQAAIKQAIALRKRGIQVIIFHRDIRVYSRGAEEMYREARGLGVLFIPYDNDQPPQMLGQKRATSIKVHHPRYKEVIQFPVDAVVLSLGMVPREKENAYLVELLKIPRSADRFFMERHPKFGPIETSVEGVFLCGCAQGPKDIADSIAQASAVASKAAALLARDVIRLEPIVSTVNEMYCRTCGQCVDVCEFHAIEIVENELGLRTARVNEALCKGCGTCASICPTGAVDIRHFTDEQLEAQMEALFEL
ncbi:MAG: FAD-dependent oxidoreductase [candidate division KSB1 bacterium]|nr:FAD-dependent oxidoreductase [candidate division KSB1 bacterium]